MNLQGTLADKAKEEDEKRDEAVKLACLQQQCDEVEMLKAMFCNPSEFIMEDTGALIQIENCLHGNIYRDQLQSRVSFRIVCPCSVTKVDVAFTLPHHYPLEPPIVFARLTGLTRARAADFNERLQDYVQRLQPGVIAAAQVVDWVKENAEDLLVTAAQEASESAAAASHSNPSRGERFSRGWIYSHHIYSTFKRRDIVAWARELHLTGFSVPGKPGIICVEGLSEDVDEYWLRLRSHSWKKLSMKDRENFPSSQVPMQKFDTFDELTFSSNGLSSDFGELHKLLQQKGLNNIFQLYFGVEGK